MKRADPGADAGATAQIIPMRRRWPDRMELPLAAEYLREMHGLRMSEKTFRNRLYSGETPRIDHVRRADGRLEFRRVELDAWVKAKTERRRAY